MKSNFEKLTMIFICLFILQGCVTQYSKIKIIPHDSTDFKDNNASYAIFRGTGNNYCGFLEELSIGDELIKKCVEDNVETKVITIGREIKHLDEWPENKRNIAVRTLLTNPFTNKAFPKGTFIFLPAKNGFFEESIRVANETILRVDDSENRFKDITGKHFNYVFCHSNGCTQAQNAALKKYISIDYLYHMGDPWSFLPTKIDNTIHTYFYGEGDYIPFISMIRFLHIPYSAYSSTVREKDGSQFQQSGANPSIFLNSKSNDQFFKHNMIGYFQDMSNWHTLFVNFLNDENFNFEGTRYKKNEFLDPELRSSFPFYFNTSINGYKGFNIQKGRSICGSPDFKDCNNLYYVNHKLATHKFQRGNSNHQYFNGFKSETEAKNCIDKLIEIYKDDYKKYWGLKPFSICQSI